MFIPLGSFIVRNASGILSCGVLFTLHLPVPPIQAVPLHAFRNFLRDRKQVTRTRSRGKGGDGPQIVGKLEGVPDGVLPRDDVAVELFHKLLVL